MMAQAMSYVRDMADMTDIWLIFFLLQGLRQAENTDEKRFASPGGSVRPGTQCKRS